METVIVSSWVGKTAGGLRSARGRYCKELENRYYRPAVAYRRMHRIRRKREIRSEVALLRATFAAVCEFDPAMVGQLRRAVESNRGK